MEQPPGLGQQQRLARMQQAVRLLLQGVGEDVEREGLVDTPKVRGDAAVLQQGERPGHRSFTQLPSPPWLAAARRQGAAGHVPGLPVPACEVRGRAGRAGVPGHEAAPHGRRHPGVQPRTAPPPPPCSALGDALFHEPVVREGGQGIVLVRDIEFASTSQDTLLPFHGRCHIAYVPANGTVIGLSKLARLTKLLAKRLQTQEQLGAQVGLALRQHLHCLGVAVVVVASHLELAGTAPPQQQVTISVGGCFAEAASPSLQVREYAHTGRMAPACAHARPAAPA